MNNIRSNAIQQSVQFSLLNETQCAEIADAAKRVLERTGCEVDHPKALEILKEGGARVDGNRVHIPSSMIDDALRSIPQFILYNTEGEPALHINARNGKAYYCACINPPFIVDRHTNEKRLGVYQDCFEAGLVGEAMPNLDAVAGMCTISNCHAHVSNVLETRALLEASTKPHYFAQANVEALKAQLDLYAVVAGGLDKFIAKPFAVNSACAMSPLCHTEPALDTALYSWELGIPTVYSASPMFGATGPVTVAGGMVVALADVLVGLVLSQLIRPGNPFIAGFNGGAFDMSQMNLAFGGAEAMQVNAMAGDMMRYLNMPCIGGCGGSDSPIMDEQAAVESSMNWLIGSMTGSKFDSTVGYIDSVMSGSIEALVLFNEVADMSRRFIQGLDVSADALAEDVIDEVGPQGSFLSQEHTMEHFRETWMPQAFTRLPYDKWDAEGRKTLHDRMVEKVDAIVAMGPQRILAPEVLKQMDDIVNAFTAKYENK